MVRIIPELHARAEVGGMEYAVCYTFPITSNMPFIEIVEMLQDQTMWMLNQASPVHIPLSIVHWHVHHLYLGSDLN